MLLASMTKATVVPQHSKVKPIQFPLSSIKDYIPCWGEGHEEDEGSGDNTVDHQVEEQAELPETVVIILLIIK